KYRHTVLTLNGDASAQGLIATGEDFRVVSLEHRQPRFPSPLSLQRLYTVLKHEKPTILLTYNWGAVEWALVNRLALGFPHLHFEDGFGPDESVARQI